MSTRCNIHFDESGHTVANIYRHSDGYPEGVLPDLQNFFEAVENQTTDTRFNDASYLAAKFIVWQAGVYAIGWDGKKSQQLDFPSLGITDQDAGDGEYVYTVDCDSRDENDRPKVAHRAV